MNLISLLRKLGIVRWGSTKAVYRTAAERPIELQMNGVFKADKDLVASSKPGPDTGKKDADRS